MRWITATQPREKSRSQQPAHGRERAVVNLGVFAALLIIVILVMAIIAR
ncbi:MAG: hypothetical protein IVW57_16725 [Ktedonobacterales bacterium]|nr:hypothetical protein [Ktedonobacterales bacterium]